MYALDSRLKEKCLDIIYPSGLSAARRVPRPQKHSVWISIMSAHVLSCVVVREVVCVLCAVCSYSYIISIKNVFLINSCVVLCIVPYCCTF